MRTSNIGIALIKKFEGCKLQAYLCPAKIPTIGYGHTMKVSIPMCISSADAEQFLIEDLAPIERSLSMAYPWLSQREFDALTSFSFNLGRGWMTGTGLSKALDIKDCKAAADELMRWNKSGGKVLPGLTNRRSAERDLFLQGYHSRLI